MQIITTVVAAVTFNLVDKLEAYVLIKKRIVKTVDGSIPELPQKYLLSNFMRKEKCRSPVKQENSYEMQPAVLAYSFYFSFLAGAEVAEASVADCDWAKPSAK
jgi:hypothetical protein